MSTQEWPLELPRNCLQAWRKDEPDRGMRAKALNTQAAAKAEMEKHKERILHPERAGLVNGEDVIAFGEWFLGRFWREWVVAQKNKPTEVRSKRSSTNPERRAGRRWQEHPHLATPRTRVRAAQRVRRMS